MSTRPILVFATSNAGKRAELVALLREQIEVRTLLDLPPEQRLEVAEDAATFEANAEKKARAFAAATGLPSLADDSGLCVDALDGRPGVQSARYGADDAARIKRLLGELTGVGDERRGAVFVCALALVLPDGRTAHVRGECRGHITRAPQGNKGFGYDPIFWVPDAGATFAQLTREEKVELSHRGKAFQALLPQLTALLIA